MSDLEKVVDKFSGFITKDQAEYILNGGSKETAKAGVKRNSMSVCEVLDTLSNANGNDPNAAGMINIKDQVYRIFNPRDAKPDGNGPARRIMILGEEGSTVALSLGEKLSEFIDISAFERGDYVQINNLFIDRRKGELQSGQSTLINKIAPSTIKVISDYSSMREGLRKVDVVGKIVEINPIKYVGRLGGAGNTAVSSCIITDMKSSMDVSFWGSSAIITADLKVNDTVKLEFCDVRSRNGKLQIYVNDDSRVAANGAFAKLLNHV
ncbi:MAG: hypothetical protein ACREBH_01650 [Candidatus Micrarchaeaceae archaeon]